MKPCTPLMGEELQKVRRQRAQNLCRALDNDAGPVFANVWTFCLANDISEKFCSGQPSEKCR